MKNMGVWVLSAVFGANVATLEAQLTRELENQPKRETSEQVRVFSAPETTGPAAVVVTTKGKVEVSNDGKHFTAANSQQILTEGMRIKTGSDGQTDIHFKRTGVALRLRENSELKLTKMEQTPVDGSVKTATAVDLERGRAMALENGPFTGPFEIRSGKGIKVAPTSAEGRRVISAGNAKGAKSIDLANMPGPARGSAATGEKGKKRKSDEAVSGYLEIDELRALSEQWSKESEAPVKKD